MVVRTQTSLFHESINDAIKDIINHAGGTKTVGAKLYPEKTPDSASSRRLQARMFCHWSDYSSCDASCG